MLARHTIFDRDGITIGEVACRHRAGRGHAIEPSPGHALVFVRRGCFIRSADGSEALLEPTVGYCMNPGEEQRYDHPRNDGDDCTTVALDAATAASLWGGELQLPSGSLPMPPCIDLEHRLLLAAGRRGADPDELYEHAITLAACALEERDPRPVASGKPATLRIRWALVDQTREALVAKPESSLPELAQHLAVSPHHLSRVFRSLTGHTIFRHRMLLRGRSALERITNGEREFARLAAELGFADQSHLCRVIRRQTGQTPTALRQALASR